MPEDEDLVIERREPSDKLPIKDLESWLEYQVDQLGTPTWWGELKAIPDVAEIQSWAPPYQGYSTPPAPRSLNRGAFLPKRARISRCVADANTSDQGLLLMPAALGREKLSASEPRGPFLWWRV